MSNTHSKRHILEPLFDQNKIKPHKKLKDYTLEIADGGISEIMLTIDVNSDSNHLGERTCKGGTITNCKEIKIIEFKLDDNILSRDKRNSYMQQTQQ